MSKCAMGCGRDHEKDCRVITEDGKTLITNDTCHECIEDIRALIKRRKEILFKNRKNIKQYPLGKEKIYG